MLLAGMAWALALSAGWGAEPTAPEAGRQPPVKVAGEIPMRPEFQVFQGVRGWLVNGQEIKLDDVRNRAVLYHGPYVLQDLVAEALLEQEAKRRGISMTEAEIEDQVRQFRQELDMTSDAALDFYLRQSRVTMGWLRAKARAYGLMQKVLGGQVYVSDREVADFYQRYHDQYLRPASVQFRLISVGTEKEANAALVQLTKSGKSFQQVAKELAGSAEARAVAGELHSYSQGQRALPPELEAALFTAPLEQVVGPMKAGNAYHLLRIEKKTDAYQFSLEEVRDTIRTQLRKQKLETRVWPDWIAAQLKAASIETLPEASAKAPWVGGGGC
jgi:foldase protein PrsA